ncbi:MAG: HD domain-containing protein [Coriobacteriia bacterium]|nr:HD domain-containing protein [Coriobacteriia bacterium]
MPEQHREVSLDEIQGDDELLAYMAMSEEYLGAIGYTEHGLRHANLTAHIAGNILTRLGYLDREAELASIAGFLHDIGNSVGRVDHGIAGAVLAKDALYRLGMLPREVALIINAIGNHEEEFGDPATSVAAAAIMADKSDVHHTRVRNPDPTAFDIHDRVNYASKRSFLRVDADTRELALEIDIDTEVSQVMEYFEIFLSRMQMCRRAAAALEARFALVINGTRLL